jgi:hypothetical protein
MTDLVLEEPAIPDSGISKRTVVWSTVALIIVLVALAASLIALKKARQMQEQRKLRKGEIQMPVGALTVKNCSDRRFYLFIIG